MVTRFYNIVASFFKTVLLSFLLYPGAISAQREVIISSDCAFDDLRAISTFLSVKEIEIKAIISSDGMLPPDLGGIKILELIINSDHANIPVGIGRQINKSRNVHYNFLKSIKWGNEVPLTVGLEPSNEILKKVLTVSGSPVTIICMGPLTDIYDFVKSNPKLKTKIKNIIWYNESIKPLSGTNYEFDKKAALWLMESQIEMCVISNLGDKRAVLSHDYFSSINESQTPFAKRLSAALNSPDVKNVIDSGYCSLWDDLLPVYFLYPHLFDLEPVTGNPFVNYTTGVFFEAVKEKILQIFSGTYSLENNTCFEKFPVLNDNYQYDINLIKDSLIRLYGPDEWRACVLTNEIHGHLGTYSIIGAKMGIRARELLNAEIDRIQVSSDAGSEPPLSCMNDGLQVSTGATLGLGMITISQSNSPSATFTYSGKKIKLTLKKDISEKIEKEINDAVVKYGGLTDGYWKLIRTTSLRHWLELNRNEIFEIEEIK